MNSDARVYILCPQRKITGGTEALHQLRFYLEQVGHDAYIVYFDAEKRFVDAQPPQRYEEYFPTGIKVLDGSKIIDSPENTIVCPEFSTSMLWNVNHCRKVIWWLSVKNYDGHPAMRILAVRHWLKQSARSLGNLLRFDEYYHPYNRADVEHYCASKFAYQYVTDTLKCRAEMLVEPISKPFLELGPVWTCSAGRRDCVAYNPAKPSRIMTELLKRNEFDFIPIQNMNPQQIAELLRSVKLYVDFGDFPGPERIPKEAAYNGAAVIVAKKNAAINDFDVNIPTEYKLDDYDDIKLVSDKIRFMLDNYQNTFHDFDVFRKQIDGLEQNFISSIERIWQ